MRLFIASAAPNNFVALGDTSTAVNLLFFKHRGTTVKPGLN